VRRQLISVLRSATVESAVTPIDSPSVPVGHRAVATTANAMLETHQARLALVEQHTIHLSCNRT